MDSPANGVAGVALTVTFLPIDALAAASERSVHFAPPDAPATEVDEDGLDIVVLATEVLATDVAATGILATVLVESGLADVASAVVVVAGGDKVRFEPPQAVNESTPIATASEAEHTRTELMK